MYRPVRTLLVMSALLLALVPTALADNISTDSDTSQVTGTVNAEISITATDPSQITLSHFLTGAADGHIAIVSTQPGWTVSIRDLDETSPGQLDRSAGSGPATLTDALGVTPAGESLFALTASNQTVFTGAANDESDVNFSQTLADGEDALSGDSYQSTVQYSVVAGEQGNGGASPSPTTISFRTYNKVGSVKSDGSDLSYNLGFSASPYTLAGSYSGTKVISRIDDHQFLLANPDGSGSVTANVCAYSYESVELTTSGDTAHVVCLNSNWSKEGFSIDTTTGAVSSWTGWNSNIHHLFERPMNYAGTQRVYFGNSSLVLTAADASNPVELVGRVTDQAFPGWMSRVTGAGWSQDGSKIGFISDVQDPNKSWFCDIMCEMMGDGPSVLSHMEVYLINPNGTGLTRLPGTTPASSGPRVVFSPDGSQVAYLGADGGLYVAPTNGSGGQTKLADSAPGYYSVNPYAWN